MANLRTRQEQVGTAQFRPQPGRGASPQASAARKSSLNTGKLPGAIERPIPRRVEPQLATRAQNAPNDDDWLHEIKFDGYRLLARVEGRSVRLYTRNGKDWTARFPTLVEALAERALGSALLDGEVVALQSDGTSSFRMLQEALSAGRTGGLIYEVFDLLHLDGFDLTRVPLVQRKGVLRKLLARDDAVERRGIVRYVQHFEGHGDALYDEVCQLGLEGIVSKRRESPYQSGRSTQWLKIKCVQQGEFVVGGFTDPSSARIGFGALLLGAYDESGELCYIGSVGTGFSSQSLRLLYGRLREMEIDAPPFAAGASLDNVRSAHWVRPELVADVEFTEWTRDGVLRHPVFRGLREDRSADEIVLDGRDTPMPVAARELRIETPPKGQRMTKTTRVRKDATVQIEGVRLTHSDRILYPEQGVTKAHLAQYYVQIAEHILPHIARRPLSLVRCPEGHEDGCFYQKHPPDGLDANVRRVQVPDADDGESTYLYVDSAPGLVALVQIGALELHVWGSRIDALETPDQLVFDLDPGPGVTWPKLIEGARVVDERLSALGLTSYPKLTGGKGLHLVVPVEPSADWDRAKHYCRTLAEAIASDEPSRFTANMSKARRQGRIFIDYLRNGRGATAVCAYSTRARAGAPVAVPISWDELDPASRSDRYGIDTVRRRLAALRKEPWPDFDNVRRPLDVAALEAVVGG